MSFTESLAIPLYPYNDEQDATNTDSIKLSKNSWLKNIPKPLRKITEDILASFVGTTTDGATDEVTLLQTPSKQITYTGLALLFNSTDTQESVSEDEELQPTSHSEMIRWIKQNAGLNQSRVASLLDVSRPTIYAWEENGAIADVNLRRLSSVYDVLQHAAQRYTTPRRLRHWISTPTGVNGKTPAQLLALQEFDRVRLLAVSRPSARSVPPPSWVRQPVAPKYQDIRESMDESDTLEDDYLDRDDVEARINWAD